MKKVIVLLSSALMLSLATASDAVLKLAKQSNSDFSVALDSKKDVFGLQFDLICDNKITEESVSHSFSSNDVRSNMSVYSRLRADGSVRVIMFDLSGQPIVSSNNVEEVLNIKVKGDNCLCENVVVAGEHGVSLQSTSTTSITELPQESKIKGNYPNPFNPVTNIVFDLAELNAGNVEIAVYDIQGRKVDVLHNGWLDAGTGYEFSWDASSVASGKYFAVISAPNGFTDTVNMTLIK